MMRRWGRFGALHEGNVDGGIWWARGAVVEHGDIMEGASLLLIEPLHAWRIWREEELSEGIG